VNYGNSHWCGIVIQVPEKKIVCYDPMNQNHFVASLKLLARSLEHHALADYEIAHLDSPVQFDGYSCGVFVALMFYRQVVDGAPNDMSSVALTRRRFELFYFVLTGEPPA
jgi:Ulp1 family protease